MLQSLQIARDIRLRDVAGELQQFPVDARRSPARVVRFHAADESPDLFTDLRSTERSRWQAPEQSESGAVPGDDRLRSDDHQGVRPTGPPLAQLSWRIRKITRQSVSGTARDRVVLQKGAHSLVGC